MDHYNKSKMERKIMKKYIGMALVLIAILTLTACGSNGSNKKIVLPKAEEIKEIEIIKNTSEDSLKIENQDEISGIIEGIKENTNDTGRESVNDQPTNIKDYIIVKFHHKNAEGSPSLAYIYKDKNSSYVEQPYAGIWKLKEETFDRITSNLIK
ncbi:DUF5301 domain-containing protein [Peptoniphilus phoceensis]|uniref:DUF5301 domain-containing protein n=2 Tax=Peptoniphilus phoceensis TaxID=1720298 RepID=UPI001E54C437|nr:DUF5301 domain-containing protein [Peptoniphilus phoceensis]